MGDQIFKRGVPAWRPEKPLHEAVRVKPGLHWRLQDTGDARAMECLPESNTEGVEPAQKREEHCNQENWKGRVI